MWKIARHARSLSTTFVLMFSGDLSAKEALATMSVQQEIRRLNKAFNHYSPWPVLIFDKSSLSPQLADHSPSEQSVILEEFIEDRIEIDVHQNQLSSIRDFLGPMANGAFSVPFYNFDLSEKDFSWCSVFPSRSVSDPEDTVERLLGITATDKDIYAAYPVEELATRLSPNNMQLLSLYHELAHCLDQTYTGLSSDTSGHRIHKAEAFAETMALLMFFQRSQQTGVFPVREEIRRAYSQFMGPWLALNIQPFSLPLQKEGGAIYYLSPVIRATYDEIKRQGHIIAKMSAVQTQQLAKTIVERNALDSRTYSALVQLHREGAEPVLNRYQKLATDFPDLFTTTFSQLQMIVSELSKTSSLQDQGD